VAQGREDLQRALKLTQRNLAKAKAKTAELVEAVFGAAKSAALSYPPAAKIVPPKKGQPGDHWALLHSTDWQLGKRNAVYNSDVCEARILESVETSLRLTELQRHAHGVSSCALLLGGDMVEGTAIFPGQAWEIDSTLYDQMFRVASIIDRMVRTLLGNFDRVEVWEEYGNHGRIGKYGELPAEDNVDRMAYRVAMDRVGAHKRLAWHPSTNWYNRGELGTYSFLLVHGDENRGIGAGSANVITNRVNHWASGVVEPFIDCYMGHWHRTCSYELANGGHVYLTGSPESGNEFARRQVGSTGRPRQRLHFVDPAAGRVVSEHPIWLEKGA
jgi:hypothetical protein